MAEEPNTAKDQQEEQKPKKKVNKIFVAVRSLPNGSTVKVEQSNSFNVRVSVSSGENSDSFILTPQAAKSLYELLGGCLKSKP